MNNGRLTNALRDDICAAMVYDAYASRIEDVKAKIAQVAYEYLNQGPRTALPGWLLRDGWLATSDQFQVRHYYEDGEWAYDDLYFDLPKSLPVNNLIDKLVGRSQFFFSARLGAKDPLSIVMDEYRALRIEKDNYRATLSRVLDTTTTIQKLLDILPEAKDFLPAERAAFHAPVVQADIDFIRATLAAAKGDKA